MEERGFGGGVLGEELVKDTVVEMSASGFKTLATRMVLGVGFNLVAVQSKDSPCRKTHGDGIANTSGVP
jgi:hypothetical protein